MAGIFNIYMVGVFNIYMAGVFNIYMAGGQGFLIFIWQGAVTQKERVKLFLSCLVAEPPASITPPPGRI